MEPENVDNPQGVKVFDAPIQSDGVTLIPVAMVAQGRSPRGTGTAERPAGMYVLRRGHLSWRPAIDVNRVIMGGQLVIATALIALRPLIISLVERRMRRRSFFRRLFG